jgi:hypothetical protein
MKTQLAVSLLIAASLPLSASVADPLLIVPGRSVGRTSLGLNGDRALANLPPTASDASMGGKLDKVWRANNGKDTLYVHTHRNDMNDPPRPGYTVTEIRVTSRQFHTRSGLTPGSTLAQIRRRFPQGHVTTDTGYFYKVDRLGIAFEFARPPHSATACLAVTVYPPGEGDSPENAAGVQDLLRVEDHG